MNNKIKKSKGFTLTELIVVIVIIGILAAVLIPTLTGYIKKANQSADEQEVAMLNKMTLLWDYEDNKPASVKELKEMLEEEGYTGDYSLRVKGNYLWYDVKENRFAILAEEKLGTLDSGELTNLATNPETYKLTTNMKTPEGLLNNNGSEVWLVGGNGSLVEAVSSLRNLGDSETSEDALTLCKEALTTINKISENIYSKVSEFVVSSTFMGENGAYTFGKDSNGEPVISSEGIFDKNIITSEIINKPQNSDLKEFFNNNIIKPTIDTIIPAELASKLRVELKDTININGSYDIEITVLDKEALIKEALDVFINIINILYENGVKEAVLSPITVDGPMQYQLFKSYLYVSSEKNCDNLFPLTFMEISTGAVDHTPAEEELVTNFARAILLSVMYREDAEAEALISIVESIALGILDNTIVDTDKLKVVLGDDKNPIQVVGKVVNSENNEFEIIYNFKFIDGSTGNTSQTE